MTEHNTNEVATNNARQKRITNYFKKSQGDNTNLNITNNKLNNYLLKINKGIKYEDN